MTFSPREAATYLPADRQLALAAGRELPLRTDGSALFADIAGFTALTRQLSHSLGLRRGAEELPRHLNRVYHALIDEVRSLGGTVISFAGDAITCWFDGDDGSRATSAALALHDTMHEVGTISLPDGGSTVLTLKVAVATGPVTRLVVGDPDIQLLDTITGRTLKRLATAEGLARSGELVLDAVTAGNLTGLAVREVRRADGLEFSVVTALKDPVSARPAITGAPEEEQLLRPWLLPAVYERLQAGQGELLTELRPAAALFLGFSGIDYDEPDRAKSQLDSFIRWVQRAAERLGGFLLQLTVGDKGSYLYLSFGAPVSNEDDARRAVSAAAELSKAREQFPFLSGVHIGISQGTMRTGPYGGLQRRTYGALGDETNLAARLMSAADDGQVLVSEAVRLSTDRSFNWKALPPITVKGRAEPVEIFELGEAAAWPQAPPDYATAVPMIGRTAELQQLLADFSGTSSRRGRLVGITGEAGLGKTRLVHELLNSTDTTGSTKLSGEGESYRTGSAYHPWRRIFSSVLGLPGGADATAVQAALQQLDPELLPRMPLLGPVLELELTDTQLTATLEGEQRKAAREALLVELIRTAGQRALTREGALIIVLEDVHWFDLLSHDLLDQVSRIIHNLPILMIATSRNEQVSSSVDRHISLRPLTATSARTLVKQRLAASGHSVTIPEPVAEQLLQQADGNPYYLEELVNYVAARGADADPELSLPASLHSLILSRLDRLNEHQKATLKAASIIGRSFSLSWLGGYYPVLGEAERIAAEVEALRRVDLLLEDETQQLSWMFRQVITRDVAYESITYATRSSLHERLARYLENHDSEKASPALLALHYGFGSDRTKQIEYFGKAAEAARLAYANDSALYWYGRLEPLLSGAELLELLQRRGQVQVHTGDYAGARKSYDAAIELTHREDDARAEGRTLRLIGELLEKQDEYAVAKEILNRARTILSAAADRHGLVQVLLALGGNVLWQQAEYGPARETLQEALELATELNEPASIARALHGLGNLDLYQGNLQAAEQLFGDSLAARRRIGDSLGVANALNNLGIVTASRHGAARARVLFEESLQLRRAIGDRSGTAVALNNVGFMAAELGDVEVAAGLYSESLALRRELGDRLGAAVTLNSLGHLQLGSNNSASAAASYLESVQLAAGIGNVRELAAALAGAAAILGPAHTEQALVLTAAVTQLLEGIGAAPEPEVSELQERVASLAARSVPEARRAELQAAGAELSADAAADLAAAGLRQFTG